MSVLFAKISTNFMDRNISFYGNFDRQFFPFKYKMGNFILIVSICMG